MEILNYQVSDGQSGIRIDRYLSEMNKELSRSYIQKLLKEQKITVNGSAVKANYKVQEGDEISVAFYRITIDCIRKLMEILYVFAQKKIPSPVLPEKGISCYLYLFSVFCCVSCICIFFCCVICIVCVFAVCIICIFCICFFCI